MKVSGSFDDGMGMWNFLDLMDIYSILAAENDGSSAGNDGEEKEEEEKKNEGPSSPTRSKQSSNQGSPAHSKLSRGSRGGGSSSSSSGFFSITASSGEVHVFEAPSGKRRDYIVRGLQTVISRLSYHILSGDAAVVAELYSEDAGQMTGELPSLITPTQALSRVSHAFLDLQ